MWQQTLDGDQTATAAFIQACCAVCPAWMKQRCAAAVIHVGGEPTVPYGVWGGLTHQERSARKAAAPRRCQADDCDQALPADAPVTRLYHPDCLIRSRNLRSRQRRVNRSNELPSPP